MFLEPLFQIINVLAILFWLFCGGKAATCTQEQSHKMICHNNRFVAIRTYLLALCKLSSFFRGFDYKGNSEIGY
jgi:hypothetical protein